MLNPSSNDARERRQNEFTTEEIAESPSRPRW